MNKQRFWDIAEWIVLAAIAISVLLILAIGNPACATMSQADRNKTECVASCVASFGFESAVCREVTSSQAIDLQACLLRCACETEITHAETR